MSCCTSIANDDSASNNSLGEFFFKKFFFLFPFLAKGESVSFGAGRSSNDMQLAGLVPCGMVLLSPGCQSWSMIFACRAGRRSQPTKQHSREFLICEFFFLFSFLAQSEHVSFGADWSSNDMQISRSRLQDLCFVVCTCCDRDVSLATKCACLAPRRSQTTFRPATTFSGNCFL